MNTPAEQIYLEGNRHLARRDAARAEACFRLAVTMEPQLAEAHANLAWLLDQARAWDEADASYRRALAVNPGHVQIRLNYGAQLARRKLFAQAEAMYRSILALDARSAPAWSNLGVLYAQTGRLQEAQDCCRQSLALDAGYAKARINLAYLYLRKGWFEPGWEHYESRTWQFAPQGLDGVARWAGQPLQGKSLLIGFEGGHGDVIQFGRYAALLKRQGAGRITLICPPALRSLLATLAGVDDLRVPGEALEPGAWDYWTSLMSLPHFCRTRLESIPADLPYLSAQEPALARWRPLVPAAGLRVGLAWKGSAAFHNDDERSLPSLDLLDELAAVPGVNFISLQKGQGEDELQRPGRRLQPLDLGSRASSFSDTAAIIACLDLVICVDTAVAHLAGAMGKPVWVLLPHHLSDWRWLDERADSPWYPHVMRLFRQPARADWAPVVAAAARALRQFAQAAHPTSRHPAA